MKEYISTVTSKGQVTIPIAVRKQIGIGPADKLAFIVDDENQVMVQPVASVRAVRGAVPALPGRVTTDFEDQIEEAMDEEALRIAERMNG